MFIKEGLFSILVQNSPKVTKKVLVFRKVARSCSLTKKLLKILKVAKRLPSRIWKGLPCIPLFILCTHVYPSNTVYPVYPYLSMFTLVILYTLYTLVYHVYPSNTVYPVYPSIPCLSMSTLVILYALYTPIYPLYPCLP